MRRESDGVIIADGKPFCGSFDVGRADDADEFSGHFSAKLLSLGVEGNLINYCSVDQQFDFGEFAVLVGDFDDGAASDNFFRECPGRGFWGLVGVLFRRIRGLIGVCRACIVDKDQQSDDDYYRSQYFNKSVHF